MNKLVIAYLYPDLLNLYGDNGNVEILSYRARKRGFDVEVSENITKKTNLVFMGGGPDESQRKMYKDLIENKGKHLKDYIENNGVGLFICGSYQLLGNYYKSSDGSVLKGLGVFDLYTKHSGNKEPRCVGNTFARLSEDILKDPFFVPNNMIGKTLVGFENHGGRTFLDEKEKPFAKIVKGHGNNSKDKTEGVLHKNSIGTYFHGPLLSRNPHLADFLIAKALGIYKLERLNDDLIVAAHTASENLKQ
jgi:CobQ-like glutamine amidotransferase family enzyme